MVLFQQYLDIRFLLTLYYPVLGCVWVADRRGICPSLSLSVHPTPSAARSNGRHGDGGRNLLQYLLFHDNGRHQNNGNNSHQCLLNGAEGTMVEIYYWRDRGHEVDFVLQSGERIVSLEVKSGRARSDYSGMDAFAKNFQPFRKLLVGGQGIPLEEFLATPISNWVE